MSKVPDTGMDTVQLYMDQYPKEGVTLTPLQLSHADSDGNIWSLGQVITFGEESRLCFLCIPASAVLTIASFQAGEPYDSPQTDGLVATPPKIVT